MERLKLKMLSRTTGTPGSYDFYYVKEMSKSRD
jgi:hypothetical protein